MRLKDITEIVIDILLVSKRARREEAVGYAMNMDMCIEVRLLDAEIKALEERKELIKEGGK